MGIPAPGGFITWALYPGPQCLAHGGEPCSGSKIILDRILKPGKLIGNVGNYEDEAELISI
jgi:hypothetical protein